MSSRGRPTVMIPAKLTAARGLHDQGRTAREAAEAVGVSRATLYRALAAQVQEVALRRLT